MCSTHEAGAAVPDGPTLTSVLFSSALFGGGPSIALTDARQMPPSPTPSPSPSPSFSPEGATTTTVLGGTKSASASPSPKISAAREDLGQPRKKLVVLGSGWGGMSIVRQIDKTRYDVTMVSPRNYFLFTPLLPGVTTGLLEARSVTEPIRRIIYRKRKAPHQAQFIEAECVDLDPGGKVITCTEALGKLGDAGRQFQLAYDYLVVAVGAEANTFGIPGEVEDAEKIRESIVDSFEAACVPGLSEGDKRRWFAAELHDLIRDDLSRLYPDVAPLSSITILECMDHILNMYDMRISEYARNKFAREGITVRMNAQVMAVTPGTIRIRDTRTQQEETLSYGMAVWSTGVGTRPLVKSVMAKIGQGQRKALATDEWLRVKGARDMWAIGDCASIEQRRMQECHADVVADTEPAPGRKEQEISIHDFECCLKVVDSKMKSLPATAQVAAQEGEYLAKCFNKMATPGHKPEGPSDVTDVQQHEFHPFVYKHLGMFAPLGSGEAAYELPGDWVNVGRSTQWLWYSVYLRRASKP
eukprot:jgi/Mesen1/2999/ME000177S02274